MKITKKNIDLKIFGAIYLIFIPISFVVFPLNTISGYMLFLIIPFLLVISLINIGLSGAQVRLINCIFGILYLGIIIMLIFMLLNYNNGKVELLCVYLISNISSVVVFCFLKKKAINASIMGLLVNFSLIIFFITWILLAD
jgi:hypothetical protein